MKPFLILIVVVSAISSAGPADVLGQGVTQTTELTLKPEQLSEEIAAWKEQLAEIVKDLSDPSKIWVALRGGTTVATDDEELVQALREQKIMDLIWLTDQARVIGARDLRLEDKSLFREEVEAFVKKTYAELVKQDKAIREIKERQAERLRTIIRSLETRREAALTARSQAAGTPAFKPQEAAVTDSEKEAVKNALEPVRLEDQWDLRDHGYVLGYLDKVKTPSQLRSVKELIADFTACYKAWLAENARIAEAARAGSWMPGKRIEAVSKALDVRNDRLKEIKTSFEKDWQTP